MSNTQDFSSLKWIKGELDEAVRQARHDLEEHIEGGGDVALMESCATRLHQIQGTLQMVQIYGAAMLAEEMELVARAIARDEIPKKVEAAEALLQGLIKLPDYLEQLLEGGRDHPVILTPLLNDLRASREESLYSEAALFAPELDQWLQVGEVTETPNRRLRKIARSLRHKFHKGLLDWYLDHDIAGGLEAIRQVLLELEDSAGTEQVRRLFRIARAASTVPLEDPNVPNIAMKQLLGRVDREIKRIIQEGELAVAEQPPVDLQKNLLYYVTSSHAQNELTQFLRREFDLDRELITYSEIESGRQGLQGPNLELLQSLRTAIGTDLDSIKDALDLFIRTKSNDTEQLLPLEHSMRVISDTLGMVGQGALRQRIKRQADRIKEIVASSIVPDENDLIKIAEDIIYVESSLENLAAARKPQAEIPSDEEAAGSETQLPAGEFERLVDSVMREARIDMAQIKDAMITFIGAPEKVDVLHDVPTRFRSIAGAFEMLKLFDVSGLLRAIAGYVANEILAKQAIPETVRLNAFADAVTSIEYFMEAVTEGRGIHDEILEVAREALVRLGTEEELEEQAPPVESVPETSEPAAAAPKAPPVKPEPEPEPEHVASADKPSLEEISPEILDIFMEEAQEELEVIREYMPRWLANHEERDALITFRRSFHTLKGSGRLVGAKTIGEFAWSIENLLNRVIDETLPISDSITEVLEETLKVLPELIECQAKGTAPEIDVQAMMDRAFGLADQSRASKPEPAEAEHHEPPSLSGLEVEEIGLEEPAEPEPELTLELEPESEPEAAAPETGEAPINLDPVLLEIFLAESRTHLDTINEFLEQYREGGGRRHLDNNLSRAYHTLHGSAHMAEVVPIAQLSSAIESYLNDMLEHNQPADDEVASLLERSVQQIEAVLAAINVPDAPLPDWETLAVEVKARHKALRGDLGIETTVVSPVSEEEEEFLGEDEAEEPFGIEAETILQAPAEEFPELEVEEIPEAPVDETFEIDIEEIPEEEPTPEIPDEAPAPSQPKSVTPPGGGPKPPTFSAATETVSMEQELLEIFLGEAEELMDAIDHALRQWGDTPSDLAPVAELQRTLHTLKGGARLAGILAIGDLSHAFESLLEGVDHRTVPNSRGMYLYAQSVADHLTGQIEEARASGTASPADDLIEELGQVLAGELEVDSATGILRTPRKVEEAAPEIEEESPVELEEEEIVLTAEPEESEEPEPEVPEETALAPEEESEDEVGTEVEAKEEEPEVAESVTEEEPEPETEPEASDTSQVLPFPPAEQRPPPGMPTPEASSREELEPTRLVRRGGREQLRINPEIMDKLVNNSGEVSIFRSRLEQQNSALGFNLKELEQTVTRLRNQLRQLDIETEAQILFRYEHEQEEGKETEDFDPLELDRFSTIQQLSRSLLETVGDLVSINELLEEEQRETDTILLQQARVATDLQDGLLRTRMVAFSQLEPRLQRLVRQTCRQLNKQAVMEMHGTEMELDRSILDRITAPLEHLVRNAVSHGIESPERRRELGKDETGRIVFELTREGNNVQIKISDDGAGLNLEAIRAQALNLGLLVDGAQISDNELMQFILEQGFSTADEVSQISGRGVGLDVVVSEVKQLSGSLEIDSAPGKGTSFAIQLPLTLAITTALLLQLGDEVYAVPHNAIEGVVRVSRDQLQACYEERQEGYVYGANTYPIRYLGSILGTAQFTMPEQAKWFPLMLVRVGEHRVALQVDEFLGHRQIVVKSVGPQLSTIRWFTGGTILGDGRVALILDVNALARMDAARTAEAAVVELAEHPEEVTEAEPGVGTKVMVVDDSITVRKVTGRLLERHGMEVVTANDGVDAVAKLQEYHPDVMLLDIEMPRMDGFELARHMKNSEDLRDIPIIIITSRTGEKHRNVAMELGVKRYLGKPYQETELLENIHDVLAEKAAE